MHKGGWVYICWWLINYFKWQIFNFIVGSDMLFPTWFNSQYNQGHTIFNKFLCCHFIIWYITCHCWCQVIVYKHCSQTGNQGLWTSMGNQQSLANSHMGILYTYTVMNIIKQWLSLPIKGSLSWADWKALSNVLTFVHGIHKGILNAWSVNKSSMTGWTLPIM